MPLCKEEEEVSLIFYPASTRQEGRFAHGVVNDRGPGRIIHRGQGVDIRLRAGMAVAWVPRGAHSGGRDDPPTVATAPPGTTATPNPNLRLFSYILSNATTEDFPSQLPEWDYFEVLPLPLCAAGCERCPDAYPIVPLPKRWHRKTPGTILAGNWHRDGFIVFRVNQDKVATGRGNQDTLPPSPPWEAIQTPPGWTNHNRQIKHLHKWDESTAIGSIMARHKWLPVHEAALKAYAIARGLPEEQIEGSGLSLIRDKGRVPIQHLHTDYRVSDLPTEDQRRTMEKTERARRPSAEPVEAIKVE